MLNYIPHGLLICVAFKALSGYKVLNLLTIFVSSRFKKHL